MFSWYTQRSSLLLCLKKEHLPAYFRSSYVFPIWIVQNQEALENKVTLQLHREEKGRQTLFWWFQIIQCIRPLGVVTVCTLYSIYLGTKCFSIHD